MENIGEILQKKLRPLNGPISAGLELRPGAFPKTPDSNTSGWGQKGLQRTMMNGKREREEEMAVQGTWTNTNAFRAAMPLSAGRVNEPSQVLPETLSDVLLGGESCDWNGFAALPSNFAAFEAAMRVAHGLSSFAVIVGPSGWGKTHLLQVAAERVASQFQSDCLIHSPSSFLALPESTSSSRPILVDGVQDVLRLPRLKHRFMMRLRERTRFRRPILLALEAEPQSKLLRELSMLRVKPSVFPISVPTSSERELIVINVALSMGMQLHRTLARLIARHVDGNGRSILGALNRLALYGNDWSCESSLPRALGITLPFLRGRDGWDLRDSVQEAVTKALPAMGDDEKLTCWLCWSLRDLLKLPEDQVSAFLNITPGKVHTLTQKAKSWKDEATKDRIRTVLLAVLSS